MTPSGTTKITVISPYCKNHLWPQKLDVCDEGRTYKNYRMLSFKRKSRRFSRRKISTLFQNLTMFYNVNLKKRQRDLCLKESMR